MTDASLAVQGAVRSALISSPALTALVPAKNVRDRHSKPSDFPLVVVGDGQTVREDTTYSRRTVRVYSDIHIWTKDDSLAANCKPIAGAVVAALKDIPAISGYSVVDHTYSGTRYLRDPSGEHSHAIVMFETLLYENL